MPPKISKFFVVPELSTSLHQKLNQISRKPVHSTTSLSIAKMSFLWEKFLIPVLKMILIKCWIYRNRQIHRVNFIDFEQIDLKLNFWLHSTREKPIISGRTKNKKFLIFPCKMILSVKSRERIDFLHRYSYRYRHKTFCYFFWQIQTFISNIL
jgi:hypothetical protein